jgi:hypothetical protein
MKMTVFWDGAPHVWQTVTNVSQHITASIISNPRANMLDKAQSCPEKWERVKAESRQGRLFSGRGELSKAVSSTDMSVTVFLTACCNIQKKKTIFKPDSIRKGKTE